MVEHKIKFTGSFFGLCLLLIVLAVCSQERKHHPNLILVTFDTTRADRISAYGYRRIRTPHMDAVAEEGTLFETVLAQVPLTAPSMASLMTSTYPFVCGVRTTGFESLPPVARTLAEILKEHGYHTSAVIGAFPLDSIFGLDQGFDEYDDTFTRSMTGNRDIRRQETPPDLSTWAQAQQFIHTRMANDAERGAAEVTHAALEWLRKRPQGPFFLWVHYFDPHRPHHPPVKYMVRVKENRAAYAYERDRKPMTYDAEMLYLDHEFGRLLDALREMKLLEKSLLVLHADHGEEMWEHEYFGHGVNLYEPAMRVPFILRGSGWPAGHRISQPIRLLDVAPTILETLGYPPETGFQGRSLSALQDPNAAVPVGPIYMETRFELQFPPMSGKDNKGATGLWKQALRMENYKLIVTYPGQPYGLAEQSGTRADHNKTPPAPSLMELYDLSQDPQEKVNLAHKYPARVEEMEKRLLKIVRTNQRALESASSPKLSAEDKEKLRSLGYVR
jgi:arylsulfatase A-like enzyme